MAWITFCLLLIISFIFYHSLGLDAITLLIDKNKNI